MFITIKRKSLTLGVVAVALAISGYLNIWGSGKGGTSEVATNRQTTENEPKSGEAVMVSGQVNYISEAKNNREVVRSKACELLTKTIKDPDISSDAKQKAENSLMSMAEAMDNENECESILRAKGFGECIVFVSDDSVNVTLGGKELTSVEAAQINDVIFSVTEIKNIKIML